MKRFFLTFLLLLGMCCNSAFAAHQLVVELTDGSTADRVTIHGLNDASLVSIYDLADKQILPNAVADNNTVTLDLSHLASGVYIIALPNHPSVKIKK